MAENNTTIAARLYLNGTNDFQQRVPDPTIAGIDATVKFLTDPLNRRYLNEFIDSFVNLIGDQVIHNKAWENPLTVFKSGGMAYGASIQEAAPKWLKAHAYNMDDGMLDIIDKPEFAVWYHTVNRQDRYDVGIQRDSINMMMRDEYGMNRMIDSILTVPRNSDNYDEYLCMVNLIAYYHRHWGFFQHHTDTVPTDEISGKAFLRAVRAYADKFKFPTSLYSPISSEFNVPVFANPDELILFITADAAASLDVDTLASVYQLDKAEAKYRTIVLPELPIPNAYALLTTDGFFVCQDVVYGMDSFYNPKSRMQEYYLHHWEIVSPSPFVPAILFTTDPATPIGVTTQTVTGVDIKAESNEVEPGGSTQLTVNLQGSITSEEGGILLKPDAVTWEVSGETGGDSSEPLDLNMATRVDRLGVLHVQKTDIEPTNVIHVTGTTSYVNPSGETKVYTKTIDVTVK